MRNASKQCTVRDKGLWAIGVAQSHKMTQEHISRHCTALQNSQLVIYTRKAFFFSAVLDIHNHSPLTA